MAETPTFTPGGVPDGTRRTKYASTRLLHEWSQVQPWLEPPTYELRLGPTPLSANGAPLTPQVAAMLRVFNRYADLIGVTADEVQVVEAKIFPDPGAISQLEHYIELVHYTSLPRSHEGKPIQGVILVGLDDPWMGQRARARGFRWTVFSPQWVSDYVQTRYTAKKLRQVSTSSIIEGG